MECYTSSSGDRLPMLTFVPPHVAPKAGVLLFHGGALRSGSVENLAPQCRVLAAHGILAVSAGYRLLGQGAESLADCVDDVRAAAAEFVTLAEGYGLGPSRLAIGGGSAGGHLALVAAMISPDASVAYQGPDFGAIVTFNPVVDLLGFPPEGQRVVQESLGPGHDAVDFSPIHFVRRGNPSTVIFHGVEDRIVPVEQVRRFRDAMLAAGNECLLVEFEGAEHGFYHDNPAATPWFDLITSASASFLLERLSSR